MRVFLLGEENAFYNTCIMLNFTLRWRQTGNKW